MNKESLALAQELNEKISDSVIYSLILRMRQLYLVECMHIKKKATLIEFKKSIKMITGSLNIYARYQSLKKGNPQKKVIPLSEAEKIQEYTEKKLKEQQQWINEQNN